MSNELRSCQIATPWIELPCTARDSGGVRCERTDPHDDDGHWVSPHTRMHDVSGNGYSCAAIDRWVEKVWP